MLLKPFLPVAFITAADLQSNLLGKRARRRSLKNEMMAVRKSPCGGSDYSCDLADKEIVIFSQNMTEPDLKKKARDPLESHFMLQRDLDSLMPQTPR